MVVQCIWPGMARDYFVPGAMINAHRMKTGPAQGPSLSNPKGGNLVLLGILRERERENEKKKKTSDLYIYLEPPNRYKTLDSHANTNLI